ncbi:MAG: hypothetical protein ACOY9D_05295 [Pseudomonadota bacterium]
MTLDIQNLAYAITQIVHNFGAVTVVGGAVFALVWRDVELQRRLAWMMLAGWLIQAVSGATFGAISYYYYAKFPDIFGIAIAALLVKVICAALGISLAGWLLLAQLSESSRRYAWLVLCILGVLALSSAAVLRWFS